MLGSTEAAAAPQTVPRKRTTTARARGHPSPTAVARWPKPRCGGALDVIKDRRGGPADRLPYPSPAQTLTEGEPENLSDLAHDGAGRDIGVSPRTCAGTVRGGWRARPTSRRRYRWSPCPGCSKTSESLFGMNRNDRPECIGIRNYIGQSTSAQGARERRVKLDQLADIPPNPGAS